MDETLVTLKKTTAERAHRREFESQRAQLRALVAGMERLQQLGALSMQNREPATLLTEIVDAAIAVAAADFGNIQLFNTVTGDLQIVAQRGFAPWWLEFWESATRGHGVRGTALECGARIIVEDVETSPIFAGTPALEVQRRAGVRALQSTPLVGRFGRPLGIFSTHYRTPQRLDTLALLWLDLLAQSAADIILLHTQGQVPSGDSEIVQRGRHQAVLQGDATDKPVRYVGTTLDITARQQVKRALQECEHRYRELFENAADAIFITDLDGKMVAVNQVACDRLGYSREEVLRLNLTDLACPADAARMAERLLRLREQGRLTFETAHLRRDGTALPAEVSARVIQFNGGPALLSTARDLSERKMLEATQAAATALREADRHKNEFLATLSHELRNPLAAMSNSLNLLEQTRREGELAWRAHAIMQRQVTHLTRLVDDVLDISRVTHGKILLQRERLDLNAFVQCAAEDHRATFTAAHIGLEVVMNTGPMWMLGDRTRLVQVVGNLLHNAVKFTPAGGTTTVELQADTAHSHATIVVRDTGRGIATEALPHLFQAFTQADTTLDRHKGGLGLGLALVKALVELHGGSVRAHSDGWGKGAEFSISLPLETATAEVRRHEAGLA